VEQKRTVRDNFKKRVRAQTSKSEGKTSAVPKVVNNDPKPEASVASSK